MSNWKLVHRTGHDHHKLYKDLDSGRLAIADNSGIEPEDTDDGILWIDRERDMHLVSSSLGTVPSVNLPLFCEREQRRSTTHTDLQLALVVQRLTNMDIVVGNIGDGPRLVMRQEDGATRGLHDLARGALQVQDACNSSGVALAMHRAMCDLLRHARMRGESTDWVNRHHIVRLYLDKLASLAGVQGEVEVHMQSYHWCQALADGNNPDGPVADMADAMTTEATCR